MISNAETKNTISEKEIGFKIGGSTDPGVHQLVWWVEKALKSKDFALGIFLDIEAACDKATFKSIEMAMEEAKLDESIQKWNSHMLRNRQIVLELKGIRKS